MPRRLLVTAMLALASSLVVSPAAAQGTARVPAPSAYDASLGVARSKVEALRALAGTLRKAADEPAPPKLTADQVAEVKKYDEWLRAANDRALKLAASWEQKVDELRGACEKDASCDRDAIAKAVSLVNMSFNLQYLQLQSAMQNENRAYTVVSNIMKTKHDTVKNSIGNLR